MPADYLIPSQLDGFRLPRAEPLPVTPWSMTFGEPADPEDAESDVPEVEPEPEKAPAKKSTAKQSASVAAPAEQEK